MIKGVDYTGVTVSFFCHDGEGNFVLTLRSTNCRDEHGRWDFGGGGLRFGETLEEGLKREVCEEYGTAPIDIIFLGFDEVFRVHEEKKTHWLSFRYKVLVDRASVINNEPDKHEDLKWCTLDTLPSPLHSQVVASLEKYKDILRS